MGVRAWIRAAGMALCLLASAAAADAGKQAFDRAIAAFNAGDFASALTGFLEARRAGLDTPGLRFNLGATYYRLQRYAEARAEFQALAGNPQWAALAHYNLGLTAQRMGDAGEARAQFDYAHRSAADPSLRTLAEVALQRLGRAMLPPSTGTLLAVAGGYDSNPALATEDAATGGGSGDLFAEALAVTTRNLSGDAALGWNAHGALLLRKYVDESEFDLQGLRAGLSRDRDAGGSQYSLGGHYSVVYFDGDLLEQAVALEAQARTRLRAGRDLRASYELASIAGGSGYAHLDGVHQRFTLDTGFSWRRALWRAGYRIDLEDRRDLRQGAEFFSYSPTRHALFAGAQLAEVAGWRAEARLEYRASRFADPYRLDGGSRVVARRDDRYGLALRGSRAAGGKHRTFVEFSYYRNESSVDFFDYRRGQLQFGVELALEEAP